MTKSTRDVSTCLVFKSSPEAFISPLFFKNYSPPPLGSDAPSHYLACTWIFTYSLSHNYCEHHFFGIFHILLYL